MLTKKQLSSIGYSSCEQIPHYLWSKSVQHLFKRCDQRQNYSQNQTFKDFMEMSRQGANQDGSGRYTFKSVKQIELTFVLLQRTKEKSRISQKFTEALIEIIASFLQIKTSFVPSYLFITKRKTIIDRNLQIQYEPSHLKSGALDVFSLFDVGSQSKLPQKNRMFLIQADLHENEVDVDGRACGDGIGFITFYPCKNKADKKSEHKLLQFTLQTVIHQTLHSLGFDHCSAWNCLMNAYTNQQFWLCPCCLHKLQSQIDIPILNWYRQVVQKLKKFHLIQQLKIGAQIIKFIQQDFQ